MFGDFSPAVAWLERNRATVPAEAGMGLSPRASHHAVKMPKSSYDLAVTLL